MQIGVPKEIKTLEARVALTPEGAAELVRAGHQVVIEGGAGLGSAISDNQYVAVGASIESDVEKIWREAEMILKVKEPIEAEYPRLRSGQAVLRLSVPRSSEGEAAAADLRREGSRGWRAPWQ